MKNLSVIGLTLALAGAVLSSFAAQPVSGAKTLPGHVPAAAARLQPAGNLAADTTLNLAIGLPLRNREALTNLLEDVYDPSSPNFHHFITPDQFADQFGPDTNDYQKILDFAQQNGLTVIGKHPNRTLLDVSGRAADIEKAFNVKLHLYNHPAENRTFFAPDSDPTVDASLPILHVSGLDNYAQPQPALKMRPTLQMKPAGSGPGIGSSPGGGYIGSDFRNAYVPGTTLTGSGQTVGLLQFDAFYPSDITAYETLIGMNTNSGPQIIVVPVDGGVATPTTYGNPEVSLDIEMVLSMAPGVSKIYVYEEPNNGSPFVDLLNKMATDNLSKQLSSSWFTFGGPPNPTAEQIFQQMALQGQSFFEASGDSDAFTSVIPFPCDSPHITVVGGTTLTTATNAYVSETVWNWDVELGPSFDGVGSSGGISTSYSIPSWQTNINMTARGGSTTFRNIPDVALTADNVFVMFGSGQSGIGGGTSCAAPLWAGFTALVNQQAALSSHAPVGFINPAIYAIATNNTTYTNCFHDITTGNNEWSGSTNLFMAVTNYDLCTGLGTPNGTNFIVTLSAMSTSLLHISPPPAPYGTNFAALYGGNPNGSWNLFIQDDRAPNSGVISNGWLLSITTGGLVGQAADLALGMTASATNILTGNTVTYTIAVTNWGPSTSSNVLVADTLPAGATIVATNATSGAFVRSGSTLIWTNTGLATNTGAQLTVTIQAGAVGAFNNVVTASSIATADPNPDDDTVSLPLNVGTAQPPRFASLAKSTGGGFQFSITNNAGINTIIQATTNLAGTNWVNIYTGAPPFIFTDPGSNYPARYYRALVAP